MLDDEEGGSGAMYSIPDGEVYFSEYATLRRMGHKEFCKMKLDYALAEIERKRKLKQKEDETRAFYFAQAAESELQTFKRLLAKYGTKEELEDNR